MPGNIAMFWEINEFVVYGSRSVSGEGNVCNLTEVDQVDEGNWCFLHIWQGYKHYEGLEESALVLCQNNVTVITPG